MDLKSGFLNIPVSPECKQYLGLITAEGLYQWDRMPFGLMGAPMHFQYVIDTELGKMPPSVKRVAYLDDVTTYGDDWPEVWEDTLAVLRQLTGAGFMINLKKCKFLSAKVTVLGCTFQDTGYILGDKTIKKWVEQRLP